MKDIIKTLNKFASVYEKNGNTKEADYYHNLFIKFSQSDEPIDDEDDNYDPENPPQYLIRPTPVFFNADTNQPIMHDGKYLAAIENDQDLPQIRGKVKQMTGIENMTLVRIPVNILRVQYVQSDSDAETMENMYAAFEAGIEDIGDFVYVLLVDEHTFDVQGADLIFSSESDAYGFGRVIAEYMKTRGKDIDISVAAVAVSIADEREAGMSMPELYGDDEFIFVSNSSFQATQVPETIEDLNRELFSLSQMRKYTVERLQREKLGDYEYDLYDDEESPDDGGDRFSSTLNKLHKIASSLENMNMNDEANIVTDVFIKLSKKKKKKSSGKNVPNNPSLWAECKAWAKRTFDVYPCVPLESLALTKNGWAEYSDLNVGDEILTYNQNINRLEWKPIINLHFYENAPTLSMKKAQTNFKVRCTPDHKWVLKTPNVKYPENLVEAKNITKRMNLKTAAEIIDDVNQNLDLSNWRKGDDWVKNVLSMSKPQLEAFFASGIVYDGHDKGLSSLNRSTYGFSQKNINHGEAMEIAAVLLGYRVSFVQKMHNLDMKSWTFIKRDSESTGNLVIQEDENCDVWCPQTENNTWIMKQGRIITITGNSAYANGAASKRYKSKGGTWRKEK